MQYIKLFSATIIAGALLLHIPVFSQQSNTWYFGDRAGIDFNASPPVALTNSSMNSLEGCASIADDQGNLLFYTNGSDVFNKNHQLMQNGDGLWGHPSSTQAAIIVPWPERDNIYFIFTSGAAETLGAAGYSYSVVDMNLQNGLGMVTQKNVALYAPSTEKIAVARHANDRDWWVITKTAIDNRFLTYHISETGIDPRPVISACGISMSDNLAYAGRFSISSNGKKLAMAVYSIDGGTTGYTQVFDFDYSTGEISNPVGIRSVTGVNYSVEFSPNSDLLYVSYNNLFTQNGQVDQFDLRTFTDSASLENTRITITPPGYQSPIRGMQLGPDGRIYVVKGSAFLDVIAQPDNRGIPCDFRIDGMDLGGRTAKFSLPSFVQYGVLFNASFDYVVVNPCSREVRFDAATDQRLNVTFKWHFGDGDSSSIEDPVKIFPYGKDTFYVRLAVSADIIQGGSRIRKTRIVRDTLIFETKPVATFDVVAQCGDKHVQFVDRSAMGNVQQASWYWDLGDGTTSVLKDHDHNYGDFAEYDLKMAITTATGCVSDTLRRKLAVRDAPRADFVNTTACENLPIQFTNRSSGPVGGYSWRFGDGSSSTQADVIYNYRDTGNFTIQLTAYADNGCPPDIMTKTIFIERINAFAGNDTAVVTGQLLHLNASGGVRYEWSPASLLTNPSVNNPATRLEKDQVFQLKVFNAEGCSDEASVKVSVFKNIEIHVPNAFTPDGNTFNDILRPIAPGVAIQGFTIYNRWGNIIFNTTGGQGWDGKFNGTPQPVGVYVWIAKGKTFTGQTIVRKGTVMLIR